MGGDGLESDEDIPQERFSQLEAERTVESPPVLEMANRMRADLRHEGHTSKADSSTEQTADRVEDPGADFKQNVAFMRETLLKETVPQPAPVQPKAVPMSASQADETPKVELPFCLFVKANFV